MIRAQERSCEAGISALTKVLGVAAAALALAGCGGSSSSSSSSSSSTPSGPVSVAGITVTPPAGWSVGTEGQAGLVLAPNQGGLTASVPVGPRFTAKPATGVLGAPQDLVRRLASTPRDIKVIGQPTEITFGATKGLAITTQALRGGHSIVSEEVVVPVGHERAYTLVLEAPANQWSSEQQAFTGILDSVTFNSSGVPIARGG